MKYLQDYISQAQTDLFEKNHCFWAFNDEQLQEGLTKFNRTKEEMTGGPAGMICPKDNVLTVTHGLKQIIIAGIRQDIEENGLDAIIRRELYNHEAFYTGDIDTTEDALSDYPDITYDKILAVYREEYQHAEV